MYKQYKMAKASTPIVVATDLPTKANTALFYENTDNSNKGFKTTATWGANPIYHCLVADKSASNVKGTETLVE